ncbi:bidirectional sugar transporter SWEET8-like [Triticum dicoccoides]|uniref:bidirectional sugar transporter SWEET8-like n=1 Tax=Triticum dicoccoides TaxID=85692 RepID=UPI00188F64B7|nr:bidirectional sugar transporter SWEET8-like [Triticum dicoccoides]
MKSVGGGTRSEPFVASLLGYACWLFFSLMENGWKADESVWLNGSGTVVYIVYLLMFLWYTAAANRWITVEWWVPGAVLYLCAAAIFGVLAGWTWVFKVMCTLAGLASASASLVLTVFVLERKVEFLPDYVSTTVSLLHYCVWIARDAIDPRDYFDMVQNVCGFGCCLAFLTLPFLPFFWTGDGTRAKPTLADEDDPNRPLISLPGEPPAPLHQPLTAVNPHADELVNLPATNVFQEPRRAGSAPSTPKNQVDDTRRVVSAPSTPN